jgi:PadR family transcriptional regulator, regulatory protein PadR
MLNVLTPPVSPGDFMDHTPTPDDDDMTISKLEEELLNLLIGSERYGLEIIKAFEDVSGGKRKLSVGSLYPTLSRMEEKGLITSHMEDRPSDDKGGARRKYFRITKLGIRVLAKTEQFREALHNWRPALEY